MFSDQYEFLIDDLEDKLKLIKEYKPDISLIRGDLRILILDIISNIGKCIKFREIEINLENLQKVDISAISEAAKLFNKIQFYEESFTFSDNRKIYLKKDALDDLLKNIELIKKEELVLGPIEILFRLEMFLNSNFERMLIILGDKAPRKELRKLLIKKLDILKETDLKILWSRIKEEFKDKEFGFEYDKNILGEDFFKINDTGELKRKIAEYISNLRPKIISTRLKKGKTTSPIFSFGIARILAIHDCNASKDLSFSELLIIKIVNRIFEFWEKILYGEKNELCALLGISSEGRIAALKLRDIDRDITDEPYDFTSDRLRSYKIILYEIRRILKITNYYITRQTDIEKALTQYKLSYEIFAKEKYNKLQMMNSSRELYLQKELCVFLLKKNIYAYGKSFGTFEIDLITEQPGVTYVIETKVYSRNQTQEVLERCIERDLMQLSEYVDREQSSSVFGILVIYNLADILIYQPKKWLKERFWILPINISSLYPSKRKQSIQIEESDTKSLIRCISVDARPRSRRRR